MLLNQLFGLAVAIFLLVSVATLAFGGPQAVGRMWVRFARFLYRQVTHLPRWAWRNYWRQILSFLAGALATLFFQGRLP